jgi:dihydroorotate dehydrogenase electron transfer subunit
MPEFQQNCIVTAIEQLAPDVFRLAMHAPLVAGAAHPGQFVMVRVANGFDPLLRRPFSIHQQFSDGTLMLLFKVIGQGTHILSGLSDGDNLDIIGPLGRGFDLTCKEPVCLIGGGMGIAPLSFLAKRLALSGRDTNRDFILLGARNEDELRLLAADFSQLGYTVLLATDDGSLGHHGFIPDLLDNVLPGVSRVYTCGPHPMMKTIVAKSQKADVVCQVSLETHMACGLGACLGCTVTGVDGKYVHVCKQGPVFYSGEVAWTK